VATVVTQLLLAAKPQRAVFGQKAQQLAVIRRPVKDLRFDVEIVGCHLREPDGPRCRPQRPPDLEQPAGACRRPPVEPSARSSPASGAPRVLELVVRAPGGPARQDRLRSRNVSLRRPS
jgi:hypothetical protein